MGHRPGSPPDVEPEPLTAGETAANAVVVPVGQGGQINLFTLSGTHLVADVTGYFTAAAASTDGRFTAASAPTRLLDTRTGTGGKATPFQNGEQFDLAVTGTGGVPPGATAVALTVTYTNVAAPGFLTVWPTGQPRPIVSTSNPNGCWWTSVPTWRWWPPARAVMSASTPSTEPMSWSTSWAGSWPAPGARACSRWWPRSASPTRGCRPRSFPRIGSGAEVAMDFTTLTPGADAAVLYNLTVTNRIAGGFITAHPFGTARPNASSVNWSGPGRTGPP